MGFSGLVDLKMSMAYRYANGENIIMDLDRGDNVHQIKQKVISFTKMVADHLMESLDDQALACAAQEILRAEQLVIVGEGGSGTICRAAYDIFLKLAIQCRYVSDPLFQAMEIGSMKQTDVLLLIVNSGRTANMVQNAQLAHACGSRPSASSVPPILPSHSIWTLRSGQAFSAATTSAIWLLPGPAS